MSGKTGWDRFPDVRDARAHLARRGQTPTIMDHSLTVWAQDGHLIGYTESDHRGWLEEDLVPLFEQLHPGCQWVIL